MPYVVLFSSHSEKREVEFLTEASLVELVGDCRATGDWSHLNRKIGCIFNNADSLAASFRPKTHLSSKEELRSMEVDKDQDTSAAADAETDPAAAEQAPVADDTAPQAEENSKISLDLVGLRNAYKEMFSGEDELPFLSSLSNALTYLAKDMDMSIKYGSPFKMDPHYVNVFQIVLEIPVLFSPQLIDSCTGEFLKLFRHLPTFECARLARFWSTFPVEWLIDLLHGLQQFITVKCVTTEWSRDSNLFVNDDRSITGAAVAMKIVFCASVLGGKRDPDSIISAEEALDEEMRAHGDETHRRAFGFDKERSTPRQDATMQELGVVPINCAHPLIPFTDFINEPLSDFIEMDRDFMYYKADRDDRFTFMTHHFLLTTTAKSMGLFYDNRIRMIEERRMSIVQSVMGGGLLSMPYLKLRIRRDHIIDDALVSVSAF